MDVTPIDVPSIFNNTCQVDPAQRVSDPHFSQTQIIEQNVYEAAESMYQSDYETEAIEQYLERPMAKVGSDE